MFNTLTRLSILKMINSADTYDKSQIAKSLVVNILHVQMSIRINSQHNPCEHTNSLFLSQKTVLVLASSVDPGEMTYHAAFLMDLHCLPKYILKCEKWCEARSIN